MAIIEVQGRAKTFTLREKPAGDQALPLRHIVLLPQDQVFAQLVPPRDLRGLLVGAARGNLQAGRRPLATPAVRPFAVTVACARGHFLYLPLVRRGPP